MKINISPNSDSCNISFVDAVIVPSFGGDIDMAIEGEVIALCIEVTSGGDLECSVQVFIVPNQGELELCSILATGQKSMQCTSTAIQGTQFL